MTERLEWCDNCHKSKAYLPQLVKAIEACKEHKKAYDILQLSHIEEMAKLRRVYEAKLKHLRDRVSRQEEQLRCNRKEWDTKDSKRFTQES